MTSVSGPAAGHAVAASQNTMLHAVNEPKASSAEANKAAASVAQPAAEFEHTTKESAGRYWVEQQKDGQAIRFDRPTTKSAEASAAVNTRTENARAGSMQSAKPSAAPSDDSKPEADASSAAAPAETDEEGASEPLRSAPADPVEDEPEDPGDPEKEKASTTTVNTDDVDREIERLRQKVKQLELQSSTARSEDEKGDAAKELANAQRELAAKDNDAYRRVHARFS